jgi:hypothetical protein
VSTAVDSCRFLLTQRFFTLHRQIILLYVQQHETRCHQPFFSQCLHQLAAAAPETKAALIRSLLPGIQATLNSGKSFHMTVSRARKMSKPTAASGRGKQDNSSKVRGPQEPQTERVEERDPFANLKRLENRPGFSSAAIRTRKNKPSSKPHRRSLITSPL